jgi:DNA mismatch repair ATPase MutL
MNKGTTIVAMDLFTNLDCRRNSLNPIEEKKRIYKLICHFCLHYPKIKFNFVTEKGEEELPLSRNTNNIS